MVGSEGATVGEPAQRGGGVNAIGDEERMEIGDHGRAGGGEEPFAKLGQFGGQRSAARGAAASVTGWP
jgi:hypothetical protein